MKRPTPVTVFAVLNVMSGSVGVIGMPVLAVSLVLGCSHVGTEEAASSPLEGCPYLMGTLILVMVTSGVLITSGIGLWHLKPWGRKLSIGYAVCLSACLLFNNVMALMDPKPVLESASRRGGTLLFVVGEIGDSLTLLYPILLLVFMFTPAVKAAFHPPAPPVPEG